MCRACFYFCGRGRSYYIPEVPHMNFNGEILSNGVHQLSHYCPYAYGIIFYDAYHLPGYVKHIPPLVIFSDL